MADVLVLLLHDKFELVKLEQIHFDGLLPTFKQVFHLLFLLLGLLRLYLVVVLVRPVRRNSLNRDQVKVLPLISVRRGSLLSLFGLLEWLRSIVRPVNLLKSRLMESLLLRHSLQEGLLLGILHVRLPPFLLHHPLSFGLLLLGVLGTLIRLRGS